MLPYEGIREDGWLPFNFSHPTKGATNGNECEPPKEKRISQRELPR